MMTLKHLSSSWMKSRCCAALTSSYFSLWICNCANGASYSAGTTVLDESRILCPLQGSFNVASADLSSDIKGAICERFWVNVAITELVARSRAHFTTASSCLTIALEHEGVLNLRATRKRLRQNDPLCFYVGNIWSKVGICACENCRDIIIHV